MLNRTTCISCGKPSRLDYCPKCVEKMGKANGIKVTEERPEEGVFRDLQ
jgi:hypothetical protein